MGVPLSQSKLPKMQQFVNTITKWMTASPVLLAQRLIEWTHTGADQHANIMDPSLLLSSSMSFPQYGALLPYMNFIRSSEWYHHLLTFAMTSLTSRLPYYNYMTALGVATWYMPPPSQGYHCNCTDCHSFHSFLLSISDQIYQVQYEVARRLHLEQTLSVEYGAPNTISPLLRTETRQAVPRILIIKKDQ
jgi:hypothetical protein